MPLAIRKLLILGNKQHSHSDEEFNNMKTNITIKLIILICSLSLGNCVWKEKQSKSICLETSIEIDSNRLHVDLVFSSTTDTVFHLDERMLVVGCPFYIENKSRFESKPQTDDLLFDQVMLENKKGQFRVFSSSFVYDNGEELTIMANCAFMGKKELILEPGNMKKITLGVSNVNDLKVKEGDKKVRVHLYLKDSYGKGIILTSSNWVNIDDYN